MRRGWVPRYGTASEALLGKPAGTDRQAPKVAKPSLYSRLGLKGALRIGALCMGGFAVGAFALVTHQLPNMPLTILSILCVSNFAMPFVIATCATRAIEIFPDDRGLSVSVMAVARNFLLAGICGFAGLYFNGTIFPMCIAMILVVILVLVIIFLALQRPLVFEQE